MRNLNRFTVSNEQERLPFLRKGVVGDSFVRVWLEIGGITLPPRVE